MSKSNSDFTCQNQNFTLHVKISIYVSKSNNDLFGKILTLRVSCK